MAGIKLCEPGYLYNTLNQSSDYPNVSDVEYLLLVDARDIQEEYFEDHIVLAQRARKDSSGKFELPYGANVETKLHIIVYDNSTSLLTDKGPAIEYAKLLADAGSQQPVSVLKGGYERFTALYPFLRTQKIMYTDQELDKFETCPIEVLSQMLFLGVDRQAANSPMMTKMKITGLVSCSSPDKSASSLPRFQVPVSDSTDANIFEYFERTCDFINDHLKIGGRVLVHGQYGRSQSATLIIAFVMKHHHWSLKVTNSVK
jgi:serine/threonine/tyrosine-interacting-like protein 1